MLQKSQTGRALMKKMLDGYTLHFKPRWSFVMSWITSKGRSLSSLELLKRPKSTFWQATLCVRSNNDFPLYKAKTWAARHCSAEEIARLWDCFFFFFKHGQDPNLTKPYRKQTTFQLTLLLVFIVVLLLALLSQNIRIPISAKNPELGAMKRQVFLT